jgi:hypothetical protein
MKAVSRLETNFLKVIVKFIRKGEGHLERENENDKVMFLI